ncbi:hypothetical protein BJ878DRAFT_500162 [Calycina marina]|uniref:FAS1 domain-containing protein n=1 Tax=Calycina marina TaxID=1763456 RepID=A0A9P7Z5N6_9HELO|nr:hypothetical protein BJ878DRAFT_500162 [Calycina marina]
MRFRYILSSLFAAASAIALLPPHQKSMPNLGPIMPPPPSTSTDALFNDLGDTVMLSDVLSRDRAINIFAGFTRDFASVSQRFEDSSSNTTILAPLNSAIMGLPRKPWEDPEDYERHMEGVYGGDNGEERAKRNVRRFVEAHVVPNSPWREGEKVKTLEGGEIWWEIRDGVRVVQPGNIGVDSIASRVYNGEVWILKGVRNYA